jgi:hypothetical protein
LEIDANELGEGIEFERVEGHFQLWTSICGPHRDRHYAQFEELATAHGLECGPFPSKRVNGCPEGHLCIYPNQSGPDFAAFGRQVLTEVFGLDTRAIVAFRFVGDEDR